MQPINLNDIRLTKIYPLLEVVDDPEITTEIMQEEALVEVLADEAREDREQEAPWHDEEW